MNCKECGLPVAACNQIALLKRALEPFARVRSSEMLSAEELNIDKADIDRARSSRPAGLRSRL